MTNFLNIPSEFLDRTIALIEEHMGSEDFGVSDLSEKMDMSRSNLLRKVQKLTGLSVSVLIRMVRLNSAKELLSNDSLNVSEIAYKVGFNSVSYFIKCFREVYGYPPGEELKHSQSTTEEETPHQNVEKKPEFLKYFRLAAAAIVLLLVSLWLFQDREEASQGLEKSIAVLPFQNDSSDSSNVYIINGLMEAVLNNLQKIEDLRVVSRTSVEKYRNGKMTMAEIAKELDVSYVIEGSGQKLGDQLLLTIQLIEASQDQRLWSERYSRQVVDIFQLQAEVAQDIAEEIEVIITPEEIQRIEKRPTENLVAYDYYLKGLDMTNGGDFTFIREAVEYFKLAIAEDPDFAHAYANIAICYYFLDLFQARKVFKEQMNTYADKALLLDPELGESLIAKGLFYMEDAQYELATEYFERALLFNPNSAAANNFLSVIYASYLPDTKKYLTYALKGIQLDRTNIDSNTTSNSYLHLSNALVQNGFINEAEESILVSLQYNPDNLFSQYVHAYILLARDKDLPRTRDLLLEVLAKDTIRLDVIQEVAKVHYAMGAYEMAAFYYDKYLGLKQLLGFDMFPGENVKIAHVFNQVGRKEEGAKHLELYQQYAENDHSVYRSLNFAAYYAMTGEVEKGVEQLEKFSKQKNYQYWFVLFLEGDPIMEQLKSHPGYESAVEKITKKFWQGHGEMRKKLKSERLL